MTNKQTNVVVICLLLLALIVGGIVLWVDRPASPYDVEHLAGGGSAPVEARVLASGQSVTTTETIVGGIVPVIDYDTMTVWIEYSKGDETDTSVTANWLHTNATGATEFNEQDWSGASGVRTIQTANSYKMTATGDHYISYDVTGIPYAKVYVQASGTLTTAGTITVTVSLANQGY